MLVSAFMTSEPSRIEQKRARHQELLQMSLVDLVLHSYGAAEPGTAPDLFIERLAAARGAETVAQALDRLTEASDRSSERMAQLTRAYVAATWALALLTAVLVAVGVLGLLRG
jgi:hypothetical protein